jgi:hypothetical protein
MIKWLKTIVIGIGVIFISLILYFRIVTKDRHPGYEVDLHLSNEESNPIRVGFSALKITPEVPETWNDTNRNARYEPDAGDSFVDGNGNGRFDPVWIAGFQNRRPAQGVHDDLWARCMVIDDGRSRIALVVLDLIGLGSDEVISIRKGIPAAAGVSYTIVSCTHGHEGPDVIGLWGPGDYSSGVDKDYRKLIIQTSIDAVLTAVDRLTAARIVFAQDLNGAEHLVEDSRRPYVMDAGIRLMHAVDLNMDTTLGVIFNWANHPETLWNKNLLLTSDFPHYVREGLEQGLFHDDSLVVSGLGGTAIFVNGAIGGLMTSSPSFGIEDPFSDTLYTTPSFDKARAQGYQLAALGLRTLADTNQTSSIDRGALSVRALTFEIPMDNPLFRLGSALRVLDRGYSSWMKMRTEVTFWRLGPASFLHYPGELYPEILNGGVEAPPGRDYEIDPMEVPPLRSLISDEFSFSIGLSNDMIGYIIPKSEWDQEEPFLYSETKSPYGEINSVGPETGPLIYQKLKEVISDLESQPSSH